ncbi:hypothetical protein A2242_04050 [Candidatus Falkowbacteria bacterium RIFOXYA2_FULL_47_9]|nr:MAG: hypothetical protein A2242_04050 [Candidatus Falkowbacteria bacterium RIFOXYA2_FULL_47_9]
MNKSTMGSFLISTIICIIILSLGCVLIGCATFDPGVYGRQRQTEMARHAARTSMYQAEGLRAQERIADSNAYIWQRNAEQAYLNRIAAVAGHEVTNVTNVHVLQEKLNNLRDGWPDEGYGQTGQRRRLVRLYVTNESKNYVVRFAEPPFDKIGELGPGETSDFPVTVQEGSLTLRYFETELGRDSSYGGRERNIPVFIQEGRTKPITIKNR